MYILMTSLEVSLLSEIKTITYINFFISIIFQVFGTFNMKKYKSVLAIPTEWLYPLYHFLFKNIHIIV